MVTLKQVTPVNFTGGNLLSERSTWVANDNTPASDRPRTLVPIIMPDIPTNYHGYSRKGWKCVFGEARILVSKKHMTGPWQ